MASGNGFFMILVTVLAIVLAAIFVMIGAVIIRAVKNAKQGPDDEAENRLRSKDKK
ncbi:hypothetical protein [Metabacillus sp. 84]|uniref:hypothetical protein n=1 Tax=unclassified Metabacillus TaxID=2675274 RepID=UPI003CFB5DA0